MTRTSRCSGAASQRDLAHVPSVTYVTYNGSQRMNSLLKRRGLHTRRCTRCLRLLSSAAFSLNGGATLRPSCKTCEASRNRLRHQKHGDAARLQQREYREAQGDAWRERNRLWREANPDYYAKNIERLRVAGRIKAARRRARAANVPTEAIDPLVVYARSFGLCGICHSAVDRDDFHVDHIVPLVRGGEHRYENVQAAHPRCNLQKGAR